MTHGPEAWMVKAEADFRSMHLEMQPANPNLDDVIFHAQQCIEKLIKGVLTADGVSVRYTHELLELAQTLQGLHPAWTFDSDDLSALQPGAVTLRYPGYSASRVEAERAIDACTRLRASLLPFY